MLQTPAVAKLSSTSVSFGNQALGTPSAAKSITLQNTGIGTLYISSITVAGSNSGDFVQTNKIGNSIAGGGSCTINVTYTPTVPGAESATVSVNDNVFPGPKP